jgi:superfamily I DNA/RNA helicase/RecB family exonuclease
MSARAGAGQRAERGATPFRLLRPPAAPQSPRLDPEQREVVEHRGGPLLVLAGPGTGKTATLVEAVLDRTQGPNALRPEEILVLTFSRAAAAELRDRIGARLHPATAPQPAPGSASAPAFGSATGHASASGHAPASGHASAPGYVPTSGDVPASGHASAPASGHAPAASHGPATAPTAGSAPVQAAGPGSAPGPAFPPATAALPPTTASPLATGAPTATTFHSFCYALLGQYQAPDLLGDPLRLLSGPEQDVVIRELVRGTVEPGAWGATPGGWPSELRARGFAEELRGVLVRARNLGLDPADLATFAERAGRTDWRATARFFDEYLDVADARGVLDYAELVHRAVLLCETQEMRAALRARYRAVFVDEYQDTDAAQTRLLHALAGDGRDLTVVGDPDQSIYAFRGADLNGILDFPTTFRQRTGQPARIIVLRTSRRAGPTLLKASREVARRIPITRLPAEQVRRHRDLQTAPVSPPHPSPASTHQPSLEPSAGHVEAITFPDPASELSAIADLLRRANLEDHVPWDQMAVLVRDGQQLAPLRRALLSANVPVEVLGDDLPLAQEPAVGTLLTALRCAAEPAALTPETARALLTGPLGGLDSADLRRLGRALRTEEQAALAAARAASASTPPDSDSSPDPDSNPDASALEGSAPDTSSQGASFPDTTSPGASAPDLGDSIPLARPADHLIREAVADPRVLTALDPGIAGSALVVARLLQAAQNTLTDGGTVEDALWTLWNGDPRARPPIRSGWPERLRRAVERGGPAGRLADRDLDAVIALFALAARARQRSGYVGVTDFISGLQAQAIAADTIADRAARGGAVQVLTAHRSKGLQWRVVVVAGVQEGLWPDLRRRGSLLEPDRIGHTGLTDPLSPAAILAEERRLFYVAITRAREHLTVTAVDDSDEDGDSPSRFLRELGVEVRRSAGFRRRPLNLAALIAELRRAATDPAAPPRLRAEAVSRLARLASATGPDGGRLVPNAHPRQWWGLYDYTENEAPVADPGGPVRLSASAVAALDACGLRWFLERQAAAQEPSTDAQGIGVLFHALAEEVAVGKTKADIDVLMDRLDRVWDSLPFDAPWKSEQEKRAARRALERFLVWHESRSDGRAFAAAEHAFETSLTVGGVPVVLRGAIDRIELDTEGRAYLVDFKTSVTPKTRTEVAQDAQLGVYQLAVESGAFTPSPAGPAAAESTSSTAAEADAPDVSGDALEEGSGSGSGSAEPRAEGVVGATVAQAELVYPRDKSDAPGPTVLVQTGRSAQPDPEWATKLVAEVAQRVIDERFHAYGDAHVCAICRLKKVCPKQPEGRELPS